uniref:Uncharacterized protein n=1 Tax=Anguilla anguilla TaxID=7936 RepID=A0A0E9W0P2_ANGAN
MVMHLIPSTSSTIIIFGLTLVFQNNTNFSSMQFHRIPFFAVVKNI